MPAVPRSVQLQRMCILLWCFMEAQSRAQSCVALLSFGLSCQPFKPSHPQAWTRYACTHEFIVAPFRYVIVAGRFARVVLLADTVLYTSPKFLECRLWQRERSVLHAGFESPFVM